ncbi:MAG: hypothetical protein ACYDB9_11200 [Gammaproteobacteria bacterium]
MSLFRQAVLKASLLQSGDPDVQQPLKTLRYTLFAQAGYTTREGHQDILTLWVAMRHRHGIAGLWDRSQIFSLPVHFTPASSTA